MANILDLVVCEFQVRILLVDGDILFYDDGDGQKKLIIVEEDVEEGNAFSGALSAARKRGDKTFRVGGKTYPVEESYTTEKWKGDVEVEQTGEYADMTIEEIDSAIKKLKKRIIQNAVNVNTDFWVEPLDVIALDVLFKILEVETSKSLKKIDNKLNDIGAEIKAVQYLLSILS